MSEESVPSGEKKMKINYSSNSHKQRDAEQEAEEPKERRVEKIEGIKVIKRKKPLGAKIAETFAGDSIGNVGQFVLFEVMLPQAKDLLLDIIKEGAQRALFGESGGRRGSSSTNRPRSGQIGYQNMYNNRPSSSERDRPVTSRARVAKEYDDIILETRGEAQEVLDGLDEIIDMYKMVTVSDLYDLVGLTGEFTDNKWGWTDLRTSGVSRVRDGYRVDLPRPVALD